MRKWFNPHRPSDRIRLFLLLLLLFSVVGFGARYLLIELGWVATPSPSSTTQEDKEETEGIPEEPETKKITEEDRKQSKVVAEKFVQVYLTAEEPKSLQKEAHSFMTRSLQATVELPGPLKLKKVEATPVQDYETEQTGRIIWNVWSTLKKEKGTYEQAWEVRLTREERWKVEGVEAVEYPDPHPE